MVRKVNKGYVVIVCMKGDKNKKGDINNKRYGAIALVLVVVLVLFSFQFFYNSGESGVERSFDKDVVAPGEKITVSLDIKLYEDQSYYLFEEIIPEGFVVLNDITNDNNIRVAKIQGAESNVFSYEVEAPSERGTYVFSGEYAMELLESTLDIEGESVIVVE